MYQLNDSVQCEGFIGRVFKVGNNGTIHVLIRINENTWKVEKWYTIACRPYMGYMWTIQNAFNIRRNVKNPTPELIPMDIDDYPYVIRLN